jgi:hypothetical protein
MWKLVLLVLVCVSSAQSLFAGLEVGMAEPTFPLVSTPGVAPPNDRCVNATTILTATFLDTLDTRGAATEPGDPLPACGNNSAAKSVWYRVTPPQNVKIVADTFDSNYDTILSVYTGSSCTTLSPVPGLCSDDDPFDGAQSKVTAQASAEMTYYFMVSAYDNDGGDLVFRFSSFIAPNTPTPSPTSTPTPTAVTGLPGDGNCDGRVSAADLSAIVMMLGHATDPSCPLADFNQDGIVDHTDLAAAISLEFNLAGNGAPP